MPFPLAIRFIFIALLFSVGFAFAEQIVPSSQANQQTSSNTQLPEWLYRELISIRQDVSVLDAESVSDEQVQELKERIGVLETEVKFSKVRIVDIYASTDRFGIIAGILGLVASIIAVIFGWISAGQKAESETKKHVDEWLKSNKEELNKELSEVKEQLDQSFASEIENAKSEISNFVGKAKKQIEAVEDNVKQLQDTVIKDVLSKIDSDGVDGLTLTDKQSVQEKAQEILNRTERTGKDLLLLATRAYLNKEFEEALEFINQSLNKLASDDDEMANHLFLKGITLGQLDRLEDEIVVYEELDKRFNGRTELVLEERVAKALMNKGIRLGQLDRSEDAIVVYEELDKRFNGRTELVLEELVAKALMNKGITLGQLGRPEDAIAAFDELDKRFKGRTELFLEELVANALMNKGISLNKLDRSQEAIAAYDELDKRFKGRTELVLEELVAKALSNKGTTLGHLKRFAEAIEIFDEVNKQFENRIEPNVYSILVAVASNKAEYVFITQDSEVAKLAIREAISLMSEDHKQERAVMKLLSCMINESSMREVFELIEVIPAGKLTWSFKELREKVESLERPKKEQVKAVVRFFEEHKNKAKLREELGL